MKYVLTWTNRPGGSSADMEKSERRSLEVFGKWSPAADLTFHQFTQRVDAEGGFAVVETDNPNSLLSECAKFSAWFVFQVHPVVDITDAVPVLSEALDFRESIS